MAKELGLASIYGVDLLFGTQIASGTYGLFNR